MSVKISEALLKAELAKRAEAAKKAAEGPLFSLEKFCFPEQLAFVQDKSRFKTAVCSRRAGKCRPKGSLIKTPTGSVAIEELKVGDLVYGYNQDGSVSLTTVTALWNQGIKDVVDLQYGGVTYASSTLDHKWLAHNSYKNKRQVKALKDFNCRDRIATEYVAIPGGNIVMNHAYSLGAFLGDGCSLESGLCISGVDSEVLDAVAGEIGAAWSHSGQANYTNRFKGAKKQFIPFYNEWINNRYAHEKICDLSVIRTWTRASQLQFVAGLIDTDGTVGLYNNRLTIRLSMQAKVVVECLQALLLDLFQVKAAIRTDNRDKYKNGPVYNLVVSRNMDSKRILKELPARCARKQWKLEYESALENNTNEKYIGLTITNLRKEQCYDITVNNDTHLFLDATGMIGHNTVSCAADLHYTTETQKGDVAYITVNRTSAKRIIWKDLVAINKEYNLGGKLDNTELTITKPNGNVIYVTGAKDAGDAEKLRGQKFRKVYIDECQNFRGYIQDLVEDILEPALLDYYGSLILIGTPGPVPAGYFFDAAHNTEGWSHHKWTMIDNPHIELISGVAPLEQIKEMAKRRGLELSSPGIQREFFGRWVKDLDSLVFKFDPLINLVQQAPDPKDMTYIFGIDIGYKDSDAIAVLGYHNKSKTVYLVDEYIQNKNDITTLANQIQKMRDKYNPVKLILDAGALGKKIQEEIRQRHGLPVEAADKHRKLEFIALLNDDLRTGKFKAVPGTRFEEDCDKEQWNWDDPTKPKISDGYHSDINAAVLYAWRECKHYFYEAPVPATARNTDQYMAELEAREAEAMERAKDAANEELESDVQSWDDLGIDSDDF